MRDIYRYLLFLCHDHHTAEDLVQETFTRAYLHIESIDDTDRIKRWLFRVAHNAFIDRIRREGRVSLGETEYFEQLWDRETPESLLLGKEAGEEALKLLEELPEPQRRAFLLYHHYECSYAEASEIMGIGLSLYKSHLFRARQKMKAYTERRMRRE
ncbi:sigma-70 family RNA polymerase sigma factor [Saccharibacillus sp. VR-M41]|uniref:Sigma-70 family RNA polymerase sigma factor n=2 Tax=Saccharibacillus alkalitolerans TaxID=2705290 RepID=A0ABX0F5L0_9BACL|nr:sigma-70 family RNA polymerase sigma factor [Saccharibacillus alkalitolerans]